MIIRCPSSSLIKLSAIEAAIGGLYGGNNYEIQSRPVELQDRQDLNVNAERNALFDRQDTVALYHLIDMTVLQMLRLLYALNKVYLRSYNFKWIASQLDLLQHKPEQLEQRLSQVLSAAGDPLTELDDLLHETLSLSKEVYPELDLDQAMKTLSFVRQKM